MIETCERLPTREEFSTAMNTRFRASRDEEEAFEAELVEVTETLSNERQENFSLLFRASDNVVPEQGIYRMTNERLGSHEIFLVPVKEDAGGLYFEAVFNLVKEET